MNGLKAVAVATTFSVCLLVIVSGIAQPQSSNDRSVTALNASSKTRVSWDFARAKTADVTCDGKQDRVLFGLSAGKVWMGMLPGGGGKPQTMEFPLASGEQRALCGQPKRIEVYPLACNTEAIGELEGCRQVRACRAFAIVDDECDSLNFYWNSSRRMIFWWRA
jgi:hypothetical protein